MVEYTQVWSSVKKELEKLMSRNDYILHLDRAFFLGIDDSQQFIIGVYNENDREWMESRLTATINNLLRVYLGGNDCHVKFVVSRQGEVKPGDNGHEKMGIPPCQMDALTILPDELSFPDARSLEDLSRSMVLPGYYFRHVKRLGTTLWWIIASFLQAGYRAGLSRSQTGLNAVGEFRVSEKEISQFAGINSDTFWTWLEDSRADRLKPFVRVVSRSEWMNHTSSQRTTPPRKLPNKIAVNMAMPLTPADTHSLQTWINSRVKDLGAEGAVELAINTPLDTLIPWNDNLVQDDHPDEILTAAQVARQFGVSDELAARLYQHVIPPQDVIIITHYFAKHYLRKLGHGPATMITWLRDRCYTGVDEVRDQVTTSRQDIADWMGLKGARGEKTVRDWFTDKAITDFVVDLDKETVRGASKKRHLRLNLEEPIRGWKIGRDSEYGNTTIGRESEYGKALIGRDSEYGNTLIGRDSEYALDANPSMESPKLDAIPSVKALLKKHLIKALPDPDPTSLTTTIFFENLQDQPPDQLQGGGGFSFSWNLKTLLEINQVDPSISNRIMQENNEDGWKFVSWLLYGAAQPGVNAPVNLAVSRLIKKPDSGPGGVYDRLAHKPPDQLVDMVLRAASLESPHHSDWCAGMERCTSVRLRNLVDHLGLSGLLPEAHETG